MPPLQDNTVCNCEAARALVHEWLDAPGSTMPSELRNHVKDCSGCRTFVKQWNGIEVGLMGLREQNAAPSREFSTVLSARLKAERSRRFSFPVFPALPVLNGWRPALAGTMALAAAALVLYIAFGSRVLSNGKFGSTLASAGRPTERDGQPEASPAINGTLPLANTNR
jgi:hypothetical protein